MARESIPDDVRRFILLNIPSIPHLEAMLLLRDEQQNGWDAKRLARRLYMDDKAAQILLDDLRAADVLACDRGTSCVYRYHPEPDALRLLIDRLAKTYSMQLVNVTNLIHAKDGSASPPDALS